MEGQRLRVNSVTTILIVVHTRHPVLSRKRFAGLESEDLSIDCERGELFWRIQPHQLKLAASEVRFYHLPLIWPFDLYPNVLWNTELEFR